MKFKFVLILVIFWSSTTHLKGQEFTKSSNSKIDSINKMINTKDEFRNWWIYYVKNIKLDSDFIGLNIDSAIVTKQEFLTLMQSGDYLPFKIDSAENKPVYKLYNLDSYDYEDISTTIKSQAGNALIKFGLVGRMFPEIQEKSLNGLSFDIENRKGKFILFKTWFINCKSCIVEFPQLDSLVKSQKENENVCFVSLALDDSESLKAFLSKRPISYEVIPNQESLMDNLNLNLYPTHIVVDKDNIILKICNSFEDLVAYIEKSKIFEN